MHVISSPSLKMYILYEYLIKMNSKIKSVGLLLRGTYIVDYLFSLSFDPFQITLTLKSLTEFTTRGQCSKSGHGTAYAMLKYREMWLCFIISEGQLIIYYVQAVTGRRAA